MNATLWFAGCLFFVFAMTKFGKAEATPWFLVSTGLFLASAFSG